MDEKLKKRKHAKSSFLNILRAIRAGRCTHQHPTTQFLTGRIPFLPPNQQCQSTEDNSTEGIIKARPTVTPAILERAATNFAAS